MKIVFLTLNEVLKIHEDQITRYGGSMGIRDKGLLLSALAQPSMSFGGEYLHTSIFDMASAYLFHILKNHPFLDGNKRTGTVSLLIFLSLNGIEIDTSNTELEKMVIEVATGNINKSEIAIWLEKYASSE